MYTKNETIPFQNIVHQDTESVLLLENIYRNLKSEPINTGTSNEVLINLCFAAALLKRVAPDRVEAEECSLSPLPKQENLRIFLEKFTILPLAKEIIIHSIYKKYFREPELTLLDMGTGNGAFILSLLEGFAGRSHKLKKITIFAIGGTEEKIQEAEEKIQNSCRISDVECEYISFAHGPETLTEQDWNRIANKTVKPLIITAFLSLHHSANDNTYRFELFKRLKALNPSSFFLVEPDVEHVEENLSSLIRNCRNHFSTLFSFIDSLAHTTPEEKLAIKEIFKYEIIDILSHPQKSTKEGHNSRENWERRALEAGFLFSRAAWDTIKPQLGEMSFNLKCDRQGSHISYNNIPLLSIFHFI